MQKKAIISSVLFFMAGILNSATLSWDENKESDLAGYIVYWGSESGNYDGAIDVDNTTSWQIPSDVGKYYFAVTAYDLSGNESSFSKEVAWVEMRIFPNPFYDDLEIHAIGTMIISNILGDELRKVSISGFRYLDLSDLPAGVYFFTCAGRTVRRTKL